MAVKRYPTHMHHLFEPDNESSARSVAHPPSAMVHIHEDLYVDAARVLSVQAFERHGIAHVQVEYERGQEFDGSIFTIANIETARALASQITDRVNKGRFPLMAVRYSSAPKESDLAKDILAEMDR